MSNDKLTFNTQTPDKVIAFDQNLDYYNFVPGEVAQYTTRNVVDLQQTKCYTDNAVQSTMTVTNLRIILILDKDPHINLSIGFGAVLKILVGNIDISQNKTTIIQQDRTLVLLCQDEKSKYRFEFLPRGSRQIFDNVQTLYRAYDTSRAYRSTRTRQNSQQYLLPDEFIESQYKEVQMLSALAPNPVIGQLLLTNFRAIWMSDQQLNVMIPFLDISSLCIQEIQLKDQKIQCVVLQTSQPDNSQTQESQQSVTIGFQVALRSNMMLPSQLLEKIHTQLQLALKKPFYGVTVQEQKEEQLQLFQAKNDQSQQKSKLKYFGGISRINDYIQEQKQEKFEIEYDDDFGVAFEKVPGRKEMMM